MVAMNGTLRQVEILSRDDIRRIAPSVFATQPQEGVSSRYSFIPTTQVLDILGDRGFYPVKVAQSITRLPDRKQFCRHVLRFRHADHLQAATLGSEIPELILTNSHDRSSAYQIMAGIWRQICSNGMTIQSADFGSISVRHSGDHDFAGRILDATQQVIEETPRILENIEQWKGIELTQPQREVFATAALELRDNTIVTPAQLLAPHRSEDRKADLWTVSQVVQENLVKGGLNGKASTGRRTKTRPIKSVSEDLKTNKALWRLTEEMAKLVS